MELSSLFLGVCLNNSEFAILKAVKEESKSFFVFFMTHSGGLHFFSFMEN